MSSRLLPVINSEARVMCVGSSQNSHGFSDAAPAPARGLGEARPYAQACRRMAHRMAEHRPEQAQAGGPGKGSGRNSRWRAGAARDWPAALRSRGGRGGVERCGGDAAWGTAEVYARAAASTRSSSRTDSGLTRAARSPGGEPEYTARTTRRITFMLRVLGRSDT